METKKQLTPMRDLLIDLKDTKLRAKQSINVIENEIVREQVNLITETILDSIINRIEEDLIPKERKLIIKVYLDGTKKNRTVYSQYYNEGDAAYYYKENFYTILNAPINNRTRVVDIEKLSVRTLNCLKASGIDYLEEVVDFYSEYEISKVRNFGAKSISELKEVLEKHNLKFKK